MKKKILALMIGMCTVAALVGCGNGEISDDRVTIKQYKGLEVTKPEVAEVTDEEVESSIESTLYTLSTRNEITDRPVQDGDVVTMDYLGKVDGVAFEGGEAEGASLEIGSGQFIDGFEEAIIGHSVGETFDINVTFPENYSEELSGKDAVFTITLHKIEEVIVPELTEELLPQLSETAKTIDEYKEEVREDLKVSNEETADDELEQLIWAALVENCVIENYPEDKMEETIESIESQVSYVAALNSMEPADFIEAYYGITEKEMAQNLIKQEYAIELIAKKEKLTVSEKDYEEGLAELATQYGYDDPELFEEEAGRETIEKILVQSKVAKFLIENCKYVEE